MRLRLGVGCGGMVGLRLSGYDWGLVVAGVSACGSHWGDRGLDRRVSGESWDIGRNGLKSTRMLCVGGPRRFVRGLGVMGFWWMRLADGRLCRGNSVAMA